MTKYYTTKKSKYLLTIVIIVVIMTIACIGERYKYHSMIVNAPTDFSKKALQCHMDEGGISTNEYRIFRNMFYTNNLEALKVANRIAAFYNLNSEAMPYVWIKVINTNENTEYYCITQDPRRVIRQFKWNDYQTSASDFKEDISEFCKKILDTNKYSSLTREELAHKYFNDFGYLKLKEYPELKKDPDFIFALLEKGFYVFDDCVTGTLSILR